MDLLSLLVTQLLLAVDWVKSSSQMEADQCFSLGFNSAKLLCSSCDDLRQFDLGEVAGECRGCCNDDGGSANLENTKYEKAILEVCG